MSVPRASSSNPIAQFADALPEATGVAMSYGGRVAGAALLLWVAADQSYDRTQAYAIIVAVVALLTLVPLPVRIRDSLAGLGAGLVFFAGALLWNVSAGMWVLPLGALAAIGAVLMAHRAEDGDLGAAVASFFAGAGATFVFLVAVALTIEG